MEILSCFLDYYPVWIGALLGLVILGYVYLTWEFDYWIKQGVPGEKPRVFMGTLKPTWKITLQDQDVYCMKKYGHFHGGFVGAMPVLYVSDPDLLKTILVKDFPVFPHRRMIGNMEKDKLMGNMLMVLKGDKWKMVRSTLTPIYTSGKLKQMIKFIEECLHNLTTSLSSKVKNEEIIDFTKIFPLLTLDIIASCAFGIKVNCIENPETEFVINAQKSFQGKPMLLYFMFIFSSIFKYIPTSLISKQFKYFTTIANQTIDLRLKNKDFSRKDFLQVMLEAEIPEDGSDESKQNQSMGSKKTLTREIVVAQTILFLLAGYETTSNTINFMVYELAQNPDIQEKLIKEVDDAMANSKGKLTYELIASMQYLDMVLSETLRKYSPAIRHERVCTEDGYKLNGITLNKGSYIVIPVYAIHHNPEFYPDPNVFDPERFSPENKSKRNSFTYLPFGAGPRNCIAARFAVMEAKVVVAFMLQNYRFQTCEETDYPLITQMNGIGFLQPKSIKLKLQNRTDRQHFD